ncbi:phosphopentomutase [Candidatus Colwellia aromaticivorans]|uniref:phosphopentomutase n=1 Tax=Candidatus Colwellia aromaticivorans TaxID=2267621 RepID=UPI000DF2560C|nr:phosphopentomutase [Candidatus Colwellia aromaticivorans]
MARAIIVVLDSFGVGYSNDAEKFGDIGANTFINIARHYFQESNNIIQLPNLGDLGLHELSRQASRPKIWQALEQEITKAEKDFTEFYKKPQKGAFGYMNEISTGKDTPSGHWEMTGVPVLFDWDYFSNKKDSFSAELITAINHKTGFAGVLGNCHASGVDIINAFGNEHIKTGLPICYTSADSVFQVAAHEEHFGLDNLYCYCEQVRALLSDSDLNVGRVIARPFIGGDKGGDKKPQKASEFSRTGNRRDYSVLPPAPTVLDKITQAGGQVISVGKIADIFAHQGISIKTKATGIDALVDATIQHIKSATDNSLIFTNLVNFDQDYGHRRDAVGYAQALENFDKRLPEIYEHMEADDILFLTADHGCDPTWPGNDHTREFVPLLCYHQNIQSVNLGQRTTFSDLGQTLSELFKVEVMTYGTSFLSELNIKL